MEPDLAFGTICILVIFLPGVIASIELLPSAELSIGDKLICWSIVIGWFALGISVLNYYIR